MRKFSFISYSLYYNSQKPVNLRSSNDSSKLVILVLFPRPLNLKRNKQSGF
nr:MAG TPA: hypothetical protein [Caudoviricetes sp.]